MKKFFETIKKPLKVIGFFILASITAVFGAWLTMMLFNYAPVFKQIGEALGISNLKTVDWSLGFLAYTVLIVYGNFIFSLLKLLLNKENL